MTGIGACRQLPTVPTKVRLLNRLPTLEWGGLAGPRKDRPARFEWRKLEWSPDRFREMGDGIHGSTHRSCRSHIFLRISMVAWAFLVEGREVPWVCAMGHGGQRIFAVPSLDLVTVVTAGLYADAINGRLPLIIFNRYVLRVVASGLW